MNSTSMQSSERDAEIAKEVERIRKEHPYNGNYRAQMSALMNVMFFKFGERIGANRLAALLAENGRSPSTSTAQDEINLFWTKIRENSAIKLSRPDVPPFLLEMFSTMAGEVWQKSMAEADSLFLAHRQEVSAEMAVVRQEAASLREQLKLARAGAEHALRQAQLANENREDLSKRLATEAALRLTAERAVAKLTEQLGLEQKSRNEETERLHRALAELKDGLEHATDEQRRLMTIGDEFKQQASRDRALRVKAEEAQARMQRELELLQVQVTSLTGEKGVFEGVNLAQSRQIESLTAELNRPPAPAAVKAARTARLGKRNRR